MMELIKAVLLTLDIEFIDMGYGLWSLGEPYWNVEWLSSGWFVNLQVRSDPHGRMKAIACRSPEAALKTLLEVLDERRTG